jgi:MFS transporter, DHA2 family, multidrug resistance protein
VRSTAVTQGIIDGFVILAALTAVTLIVLVTRKAAPPGPASHISLFGPRDG